MPRILTWSLLLFPPLCADPVDLNDLSGAWRVSGEDGGKRFQFDLVIEKTTLQVAFDGAGEAPYYRFDGQLFSWDCVGMAVVEKDAKKHLVWFRMASPNAPDTEGTRLDAESTLVVRVGDDELGLGGDFEDEELCVMRRLPMLVPAAPAEE